MVPDFQSLMLPTLKALDDGNEVPVAKLRTRIAVAEGLTELDLREVLPSGRQSLLDNRVGWALTHMGRAGLVERVRRAVYRLTPDGRTLLSRGLGRVDLATLGESPAYAEWSGRTRAKAPRGESESEDHGAADTTPQEALERAAKQLRIELQADVLARIRHAPPAFLESVVVELLTAMGYGGGDAEMARVTGGSGDGGIDGKVREDALGLDEVYVQAKRYSDAGTVGEGDLRNFAGAIDAAGTVKGVFVTTATFTTAAFDCVRRSPKRIVLIDGDELARLMVRYDIGVRSQDLKIKRIDEDYFDQDGA